MAKVSDLYGSKYLSAADLPDKGHIDGAIIGVGEACPDPQRPDRARVTLDIEEIGKPVIVNATNAGALARHWGDETDDWLGKAVRARKGKTMFQGRYVDSVVLLPVPLAATEGNGKKKGD